MMRSPAPDVPAIKVLLVEDNPGDARLIRELLAEVASFSFAIECVDRLKPALTRQAQGGVDVVLLDLALPDSSGYETFAAIYAVGPDVPIIVLTGLGDEATAIRVVQDGAQDYLVKGHVNSQVLGRSIRYAVERQRMRVELRASERRWRAIVSSAMDAVITMDAAGVICDWNPRAEAVFGWPAADVLGRLLADTIVPPQHRAAHQRGLAHFLATGTGPMLGQRIELTAIHQLGHEFPVELTVTPIRVADAWLFCAFVRDITDRQRRQNDITNLTESLERRVTARTTDLAVANRELEAFTYSVSHDLRAPLRHVSSFVRILVDEFRVTLDPKAQHYLKRIEDGAKHMGQLVDALLNLARVGKQDLRTRTTPLKPLVENVIGVLKGDLEARRIDWRVGELAEVECDPALIEVVFTNLLANAVKYTRPRERALIEVGQTICDGLPAVFVRDNGVGFDMAYADKLFGVFQRLHRAEDFEGTGVGLATVQRIIHRHRGRVWAEAAVDTGATFYFTLGAPLIHPSTTPAKEVA